MRVGILGGGQLARMLALAGHPLGLTFVVLDPAADACAGVVAKHLQAGFDDASAWDELANRTDLVTYEFENLPAESVARIARTKPVYPSAEALALSRDRLKEKTMFRELGIETASFVAVDDETGLRGAIGTIGVPAVLKTRTLGYDGKGQCVIRRADDLETAWRELGGVPCILESLVPFQREVSVIAVRSRHGETAFYPVAENTHRDGILRTTVVLPDDPSQQQAEQMAGLLLDRMQYVGVLALELFDTGDGLLANEIAPRVHNSGHWTIDGAETSQFENHLRAILGLPLGDCSVLGAAAMVNFIGGMPRTADVLAVHGAHLHDYGKQPRQGRKVGHANLRAQNAAALLPGIERLQALAANV